MRRLCHLSLVSPTSCLVTCLGLYNHQATYIAASAYKQWYNEAMYLDPTKVKMGLVPESLGI